MDCEPREIQLNNDFFKVMNSIPSRFERSQSRRKYSVSRMNNINGGYHGVMGGPNERPPHRPASPLGSIFEHSAPIKLQEPMDGPASENLDDSKRVRLLKDGDSDRSHNSHQIRGNAKSPDLVNLMHEDPDAKQVSALASPQPYSRYVEQPPPKDSELNLIAPVCPDPHSEKAVSKPADSTPVTAVQAEADQGQGLVVPQTSSSQLQAPAQEKNLDPGFTSECAQKIKNEVLPTPR